MVRQTTEAYIKGLKQGYALAESQYVEIIRDSQEYGVSKGEVLAAIEQNVCRWCDKYNSGQFNDACALCKVSQCYQAIHLIGT